ncbi:MAG: rod shape-determining protein MreD [Actinobacteria bacterium]|nr:rod shape-determining protein MreD [Actinomycetota bacterium]
MSKLRLLNTSLFLLITFFIQESLISLIHFPWHGFSLYVAVLLALLAFEDRTGALVFGFIGGLILDLAPSAVSPFGQWALAMTFIGYLFSINRESIGDFTDRPLAFVSFLSVASALAYLTFLFLGLLLGQANGGFGFNLGIVAVNSLYTFFITPIFLPIIIRVRKLLLSSRDLI